MTFRQFAFNNVFRNKRLYAAYFLSSLFTVMVFFTFANFAFHPTLTGEAINSDVTFGMLVAGGIIYVFSFFFILYSMSAFLNSRKHEFGVLIIQGMSDHQIRRMVFIENMLIGFLATVIGMGLGLIFSKVILLIAENLLVIEGSLQFYFPSLALVITFISFIILFFIISIFVTIVLRTKKLVTLLKGDEIAKTEPKANIWLTLLAVLLLGSGYVIALIVEGTEVVIAMIPVIAIVTLGTYLLFSQLSVYLIRKLKNNQNLFWKRTNMLLFSDLAYRMKDNARAFFIVAIVSAVAFSAIGSLVGFQSLLTTGVKEATPVSFQYSVFEDTEEEDLEYIDKTLTDYDIDYEKASIDIPYYEQDNWDNLIAIVPPETYNAYAKLIGKEQIELAPNEVAAVEKSSANIDFAPTMTDELFIELKDGTKIEHQDFKQTIAEPDVLPVVYDYIIADEQVISQLGEPENVEQYVSWHSENASDDALIAAGDHFYNEEMYGVHSKDYTVYEIIKVWSPILFVGLFIGIVFFVSAGSFLYFRLYADLDDDKVKFSAISKIGLTTKEMSKIVSKQVAILFFTPIIVALIHGAVALTALSHMFDRSLLYEASLVLGIFFIIQVVYFFIVRYFYVKQVKRVVK